MREIEDGTYTVRRFDSLGSHWSEEQRTGEELRRGLTVSIAPQGFHLLEMRGVV
jgi:hypothetical protein